MKTIKSIFFDQDGVIIDTERDGHRVAFNQTFKEFGFNIDWDINLYHRLLQIGGGKERMKYFLHNWGFGTKIEPENEDLLINEMHKRKTNIFINLIESGKLPLRPGIHRFMQECVEHGLEISICTTSNERAANAIAKNLLSDIPFSFILAGDVVKNKKPDPEIYNLALSMTGCKPNECWVVEDSQNGVNAAHSAGISVIATINQYTENEDLSKAKIIVSNLGDEDGEKGNLLKGNIDDYHGVLHLSHLTNLRLL